MAKHTIVIYTCEKCNKELKGYRGVLDIVTDLLGSLNYWSRLHVYIIHRHGVHNDAKEERAELCQDCTIALLKDALRRVQSGERATKGSESSYQKGWE
jgi:hypothetical protein